MLILMCVMPVVFCTIVGVRYVNTYSRTQLYIFFLSIQDFTTSTCFGPICGPSSGGDGPHIGPKHVVVVNSSNIIINIVVLDCKC